MRRLSVLTLVMGVSFPGSALPATPATLVGRVGLHDAFKISLAFPNGTPIRSIPAGKYAIVVHDYSKLHNFALGSVTQNRRIFTGSISGVGTRTYTVRLKAGTYAFACSAHPQVMNGTFVVR